VVIRKPSDVIWSYLGDVSKIPTWDQGVSRTQARSKTPKDTGFEFDTFAYPRGASDNGDWGKMSYRVTETDPARGCTVQLTSTSGNARHSKSAEWNFRVEAEPGGGRVFCAAIFSLKWQYLFLGPAFLAMRCAIRRDLERLKEMIERAGSESTKP
jgi:hypothetical protein